MDIHTFNTETGMTAEAVGANEAAEAVGASEAADAVGANDTVETVAANDTAEAELDADRIVADTVAACRLFTVPADTDKYYNDDRRDEWNSDSDEIMLLLQYFNNCLLSGDPEALRLARDGFGRLTPHDDDALVEVLSLVLMKYLTADELAELFDPDQQPEHRRYALALAAGSHPDLIADGRGEQLYSVLKQRFRTLLRTREPVSTRLFEEAIILAEFRDNRIIPVLRRYASLLREPAVADLRVSGQPPHFVANGAYTPAYMYRELVSELNFLGAQTEDLYVPGLTGRA